MIFPPASPVAPVVIENQVPAESRIGKPYQNLYQTESDGLVPEDADTHGTHVKMRQNGTKTGRRGAIPTLASISTSLLLSMVCGVFFPRLDPKSYRILYQKCKPDVSGSFRLYPFLSGLHVQTSPGYDR
jgi:hypothetical protein